MDLKVVYNYYKSVSYMCAYFSKSEAESSEAMKQTAAYFRVDYNSFEENYSTRYIDKKFQWNES